MRLWPSSWHRSSHSKTVVETWVAITTPATTSLEGSHHKSASVAVKPLRVPAIILAKSPQACCQIHSVQLRHTEDLASYPMLTMMWPSRSTHIRALEVEVWCQVVHLLTGHQLTLLVGILTSKWIVVGLPKVQNMGLKVMSRWSLPGTMSPVTKIEDRIMKSFLLNSYFNFK